MIPLWKGKNPIYFGVIRSKVKVIVTINKILDNQEMCASQNTQIIKRYNGNNPKINRVLPLPGKNPIYFGVIRSKVKVIVTINRMFDNRVVSAQ
jgi:hypothetical protein